MGQNVWLSSWLFWKSNSRQPFVGVFISGNINLVEVFGKKSVTLHQPNDYTSFNNWSLNNVSKGLWLRLCPILPCKLFEKKRGVYWLVLVLRLCLKSSFLCIMALLVKMFYYFFSFLENTLIGGMSISPTSSQYIWQAGVSTPDTKLSKQCMT